MHASAQGNPAALATGSSRGLAVVETALVFLIFFIAGAWPVPDVNEPHYLTKARHYWNPAWCADDFFLNSADAHLAFYWTFGWLTRLMPLAAVAWCGRLLTWGLLAWSWRRLSASLVAGPFYAVFTAALFVTLNERCQMAGEWVIGGVEAKGFAYVLVLLALEAIVRERWGARHCCWAAPRRYTRSSAAGRRPQRFSPGSPVHGAPACENSRCRWPAGPCWRRPASCLPPRSPGASTLQP